MLKYLSVLTLLAVSLTFTGCKSKEQTEAEQAALKAEQDKLQGKWKLASRSGDEDEEAPEPNSYYVIEGDIFRLVFTDKDGKEETIFRQKMAITPNKEPKQVDLTYVDEAGKPITSTDKVRSRGKTKSKTTTLKDVAIYQLDGDKLKICISYDDKKRPTDFTTPRGSARYVLNLEKMK
ncbi:unnamed protein product [Gemmata massiliana]|uniref:Lipocalin-like domain-containing protein n=1 Tax=Gemmata massiliana TaxID=1210884 RepID=A0A6P2CQZ2_9BACT|nr:TIGR03067 domain-containing protein [Gemmata massiliana]VTR91391.1 unnamed protein product [Gemmata massiliana]